MTIEDAISGAELRVYDDNGVGTDLGDELAGVEVLAGTTFQYAHDGSVNDIYVQMIADDYEEILLRFTLSDVNQTLKLNPVVETNT